MCKRRIARAAGAVTMTMILPGAPEAQAPDTKAAEVIAAARTALGGDQRIAGLRTLSLKAEYRRELGAPMGGVNIVTAGPGGGATQTTGDIEIDVMLPDKYIRVDTGTGMLAVTRTEGFDGDRPLMATQSNSPHIRIMEVDPANDPERARAAVNRNRAELARLLLGMIAGTQPGFDVAYSYVGQAEAPDGKAEVVDVKGPEGFSARLFIDTQTHLPLMLTYMAPEPRIIKRVMGAPRGAPPREGSGEAEGRRRTPPPLTPEERERLEQERRTLESTPQKLIEYRVFFSDYRDVNGLLLPHRIVRGTAAATSEEWDVKTFKVNPSIKAERFTIS